MGRARKKFESGRVTGRPSAVFGLSSRIRLPSGLRIAFSPARISASPQTYNMKTRLLLMISVVALAFAPAIHAQDKDEPETELGKKMEKMSGAFRALRRQVEDSSKNAD